MKTSYLTSLLLEALRSQYPDVHFIDNFQPGSGHPCSGSGFDQVAPLRVNDYLKPVLIFSLDSPDMLLHEHLDILAPENRQSVFYLQLPCSKERLEETIQQVRGADDALPLEKEKKIQTVRAFKHTCDNVCMAQSARANRAKGLIDQSAARALECIRESTPERIQKIQEEYERLAILVASLGIREADRIPVLFTELRTMAEQIAKRSIEPQQALELSFACVKKFKRISEILNVAKL